MKQETSHVKPKAINTVSWADPLRLTLSDSNSIVVSLQKYFSYKFKNIDWFNAEELVWRSEGTKARGFPCGHFLRGMPTAGEVICVSLEILRIFHVCFLKSILCRELHCGGKRKKGGFLSRSCHPGAATCQLMSEEATVSRTEVTTHSLCPRSTAERFHGWENLPVVQPVWTLVVVVCSVLCGLNKIKCVK